MLKHQGYRTHIQARLPVLALPDFQPIPLFFYNKNAGQPFPQDALFVQSIVIRLGTGPWERLGISIMFGFSSSFSTFRLAI